jgi:hypothetical protein
MTAVRPGLSCPSEERRALNSPPSVSIYSSASGSTPPSVYSSPSVPAFHISARDSQSASPTPMGGIRLPGAPLSEIASLQGEHPAETPRTEWVVLPGVEATPSRSPSLSQNVTPRQQQAVSSAA